MRRFFILFIVFFITSLIVAVVLEDLVWKDETINMEYFRSKAIVQAAVAFVWAAIMSTTSKKKVEK